MAAKTEDIRARLEQIKQRAAEINANTDRKKVKGVTAADLAEEAAGLALELLDRNDDEE